jgi:hypothetical protein
MLSHGLESSMCSRRHVMIFLKQVSQWAFFVKACLAYKMLLVAGVKRKAVEIDVSANWH